MSLAQIYAIMAVVVVALFALAQRLMRPPEERKSPLWLMGAAVAIWLGCLAAVIGWFFLGHLFYEDPPSLAGPEGQAISYVAVRDEGLDAEALWRGVHDDVQAETSQAAFVACADERAVVSGFAALPAAASQDDEGFEPEGFEDVDPHPGIGQVAEQEGEVTSTNVLVLNEITYSVADRRDDRGVTRVDVRIEGPQGEAITTVMLAPWYEDQHSNDPRFTPDEFSGHAGFVVGTEPADPCLVGSDQVIERRQTTGMVSFDRHRGETPELVEHRVLAVVWDGEPGVGDLVGGAFWWGDDEGNGGDAVHLPNDDGRETVRDIPFDEPRRPLDWVVRAFLPTEIARIDPGTYTVEVWANPDELAPSADGGVPVTTAERSCTFDLEVTAGTHTVVVLDDVPVGGGECSVEALTGYDF